VNWLFLSYHFSEGEIFKNSHKQSRKRHVICVELESQILKVGRFSIGWFMLAARRVSTHLDLKKRSILLSIDCVVQARNQGVLGGS